MDKHNDGLSIVESAQLRPLINFVAPLLEDFKVGAAIPDERSLDLHSLDGFPCALLFPLQRLLDLLVARLITRVSIRRTAGARGR